MDEDRQHLERARASVVATLYTLLCLYVAVLTDTIPRYFPEPYHTSALSGAAWLQECLEGHPRRSRKEFGMRSDVFGKFVDELRACGLKDSKFGISVEEQAAIFLHICVTGASVEHAGERMQHTGETISRYFRKVLSIVSGPTFYNKWVSLPTIGDSTPPRIAEDPKFHPYFKDVIGAIDGTHVSVTATSENHDTARNRKGGISQNVLACCSMDMRFVYIASGHDGCAADASMLHEARISDLPVPAGKYYLADAGFGSSDCTMVPFRGTKYHLKEFGRSGQRPSNKEELFNLRHASLRNVIERIFGVLKARFKLLDCPPGYSMDIQARIPPALAALHNFILYYDVSYAQELSADLPAPQAPLNMPAGHGTLAQAVVSAAEKTRAEAKREEISQAMWLDYQHILRERGLL